MPDRRPLPILREFWVRGCRRSRAGEVCEDLLRFYTLIQALGILDDTIGLFVALVDPPRVGVWEINLSGDCSQKPTSFPELFFYTEPNRL